MGADLRKHKSRSRQNETGREKARKKVNEWVSTMGRQGGSTGTSKKLYGTPSGGQNNATTLPSDVYVPIPGTCEHVMFQGKEEFRLQMELSLLVI